MASALRTLLLLVLLAWPRPGSAADPAAVITELHAGSGDIRVKAADEPDWKPPKPLLALRPGDAVRVSGDGRVVIVLTGGRGSRTITDANSPFTVASPTGEAATDRARAVIARVTALLTGHPRERTYQPLVVRSARVPPPTIVAPREGAILPGRPIFEWVASVPARYRVTLHGPQGPVWEQENISDVSVRYPASAPALVPGARYRWQLETPKQLTQQAEFEVVSPADDRRIRGTLDTLTPARASGYSPVTLVVLRAAYLLEEGLPYEARAELMATMPAHAREPTLHHLMGRIYDRIGLPQLAAESFDRADDLADPTRRAR